MRSSLSRSSSAARHFSSYPASAEDPTATTGQRLEAKLAERHMGKRQLARKSNVSYRTVCRIVKGDRIGSLDTWMKVASALECDVPELIGER